jgi:ferritin-like metal-binding protein YciE
MDTVRGEQPGRDARDGYVTEHVEIATYELLERMARHAGDMDTAQVARENLADEERMARIIAGSWDKVAQLSLHEEGVPV